MMLLRYLRDLGRTAPEAPGVIDTRPCFLNVGGSDKFVPVPSHYANWRHVLLDIDPGGKPDVVCDARELTSLPGGQYDAVYCSHNLEHYYKHDGVKVLHGFLHVLKPDGFVEIRVPDVNAVIRRVVDLNLDIEDTLYQSKMGPVSVCDVLYGLAPQIEQSGVDFYAHKTGFTARSLGALLHRCGFANVYTVVIEPLLEVRAFAFKREPTAAQRSLIEMPISS